ncbi:hypothetical protein FBALC1_16757 [Flavobacteriales bacterium ALC-1]|nr:hypothetical protein FBALC1_16757 [Flavobacteriales bacterium ALC-1]
MKHLEIERLKKELSIKAKNGVDFILAASIIWIGITFIWTLSNSAYNKSIFTFIVGGPLLPLAYIFSKVFKTQWKIKENPIQPLGLWLNFAQLFYFPFLILILIKSPEYFVTTYAIITGAHLFPYAWFYNEKSYAIIAGIISIGALLIQLNTSPSTIYYVPLFTAVMLLILAISIYKSYLKKNRS